MKIIRKIFTGLLLGSLLLLPTACESKFDEFLESPSWLGPNIYDYLEKQGNYTVYLKLVNDCGYKETMQKTGSVTLFVANDEAFKRFFAGNSLGITSYETMPEEIKYLIVRSGLLGNAYLTEKLSTTETGNVGQILRRTTSLEVTDVVPFVNGDTMPDNKYWTKFKGRTFPLLQDASQWTMIHFTKHNMAIKGIAASDFEFISGGKKWTEDDLYIYNTKIVEKDIACKNGYINVLENVLIPPVNMAQYIRYNKQLSEYNNLMNRFCAPYYNDAATKAYKLTHTQFADSIFELRYFNTGINSLTKEPDARGLANGNTVDGTLMFDPGWNRIQTSAGANVYSFDMPAMFVPTNDAMRNYFSASGEGNDLYEEFKSWDNVPNSIVADFVSNHMKKSFLSSLPSQFEGMKDESGYLMNVSKTDIVSSFISKNGLVYTINKVLPPLDYRTVLGPVKINSSVLMFQKAQGDSYTKFIYYFRSLLNNYSYFATLDANLRNYRDPVSQGYLAANRQTWKFKLTPAGAVVAVAYKANGDSLTTYTDARVNNRLQDIFDLQTIVGEIEDGQKYYITKGGGAVKVDGHVTVAANGQKMFTEGTIIQGGGNIERGTQATVVKNYPKVNGCTYFVDGVLENPITSVFGCLQSNSNFSRFFELCNAAGIFTGGIVTSKALNNKVNFFQLYHYTVYVPTNQALDAVIGTSVLPSQAQIEAAYASSVAEGEALEEKRLRFLRYHFQDNSIFIGGKTNTNESYLSATLNNSTGKFYPLYVTNTSETLTVKDVKGNIANVLKQDNSYNLMTRDILMNSGDLNTATQIVTSSFAVVHLIDKVLRFE